MPDPPQNGFRTFLIVWFTQSVSVFGSALTLFAVTIWLTQVMFPAPEQRRQLALAITGVSLARLVPAIFGSPLAGAWADRHDRKLTMMVMDCLNGVLSLALVILIASGAINVWMLLGLMVLASVFDSFHYAAFDTSYIMIVPEKQLARANGMMQTMSDLSGIVSPALAAAIISLPALARQGLIPGGLGRALAGLANGMPLAIGIDAITFLLAGLTLVFLYIPSPRRTDLPGSGNGTAKSIWADMREGAVFILRRRPMLWLLISFTMANLFGSPLFALQPLLVKFNLSADWLGRGFSFETALAMMNSMASLGAVLGGILISTWGGLKTRRVYGILLPMIFAAVAQVVLGLSSFIYLAVAMIFLLSSMIPIMNAHNKAIWQAHTPRELQGRVLGVRRIIVQFTWPLSTAVAGWVSGVLNPGLVVAIMGVCFLAVSLSQLVNQSLLHADEASEHEVAVEQLQA